MRYLSFDIESTGLDQDCEIIEFAMIPFDAETGELNTDLQKEYLIKCSPYEKIESKLNPWVKEHMKDAINKSAKDGIEFSDFKNDLTDYLESKSVKNYFNNKNIVLFGKSMNAIDLPFLNRDLGWDYMRKYFSHRVADFSSICHGMIDLGLLPPGSESGSKLMNALEMGEVAHTALEDAKNTAIMYLRLIEKFKKTYGVSFLTK